MVTSDTYTPAVNDGHAIIGHVIEVTGSSVIVSLARVGEAGDAEAQSLRVGDLVLMPTRNADVYGVVSHLRQNGREDAATALVEFMGQVPHDGLGAGRFQRGVSWHPQLLSEVRQTTVEDAALVYARPEVPSFQIGAIHQERRLPAFLMTNELLTKHFAILGTTGSGKSCAVALILHEILDANPMAHVVLLDPHDEYHNAFRGRAEVIHPGNLQLPCWLLNFEESVAVFVTGEGRERHSQIAILKEALLQARKGYLKEGADASWITVDTPTPYRLSDLTRIINHMMGRLDKPENSIPYQLLLTRIDSLNRDRRFAFMFSGMMVRDTMAEILARILRVPTNGRPITIFNLAAVPSEIVDVVVSVLCRMIFDFGLWATETNKVPVLLVCEEAHRYAPRESGQGFGPTTASIARIAKEGRKYGVGVCLVSQRPSELSTTILSQCGTIFALRMSNEHDQEYVRRTLPEGARSLLSALPAMRPQEAIVVGEGVSVPMRVALMNLQEERQPKSASARYSDAWSQETADFDFLQATVDRWRRQLRESPDETAEALAAEQAEAAAASSAEQTPPDTTEEPSPPVPPRPRFGGTGGGGFGGR